MIWNMLRAYMIRWGLDYLKRGYEVYCERIDKKLEKLEYRYQEASGEYETLYHNPIDAVE